jgi:hypothetical protein
MQGIMNKMACKSTCQVVEVVDGGHSLLAVNGSKQRATYGHVLGHMLDFAEAQLGGRVLGAREGRYPWATEEDEKAAEAVCVSEQQKTNKGKREEKEDGEGGDGVGFTAKRAKAGK